MQNTTLCYITRGDEVLMLHRVKKENDINRDKWIGVGGKFENEESPDECLFREVKEETGLTLTNWKCRGIVTFICDGVGEYMYLFTADGFSGELIDCDEGELCWVKREFLNALPKWEGDEIFWISFGAMPPFSCSHFAIGEIAWSRRYSTENRSDKCKSSIRRAAHRFGAPLCCICHLVIVRMQWYHI